MLGGSSTAREALCAGTVSSNDSATAPPLPSVSAAGERGLATLEETQRVAANTERLGMTILGQLGDQRNQLTSAIERREEAHAGLAVSSRLIRQMHRRASWMKAALVLIILTLVAGLILVVYLHWGVPHHPASPPPPQAAVLDGRLLQTDGLPSPPPQSLTPSPPPAPTPVIVAREGIGAGVVILIVVGALALLACALVTPRSLPIRCGVGCCAVTTFTTVSLVLLLMPREPHPASSSGATQLNDISGVLRIVLMCVSATFAVVGGVLVLVTHAVKPQKAPTVSEPELPEAYRLAPA